MLTGTSEFPCMLRKQIHICSLIIKEFLNVIKKVIIYVWTNFKSAGLFRHAIDSNIIFANIVQRGKIGL
ncbi:hypothetical protein D3C81_1186130 [compost metagenome]